jgi:hypothetical protein
MLIVIVLARRCPIGVHLRDRLSIAEDLDDSELKPLRRTFESLSEHTWRRYDGRRNLIQ